MSSNVPPASPHRRHVEKAQAQSREHAHHEVATIPLRRRDRSVRASAIIDLADYPAIAAYRWNVVTGYGHRLQSLDGGRRRHVWMHREILGLDPDDLREGDHINGNRLDNRRSNLRIVTRAQNNQNTRQPLAASGHRNVHWHAASGLWAVRIEANGHKISGGYFRDRDEAAAVARDLRRVHLPFAVEVGRR